MDYNNIANSKVSQKNGISHYIQFYYTPIYHYQPSNQLILYFINNTQHFHVLSNDSSEYTSSHLDTPASPTLTNLTQDSKYLQQTKQNLECLSKSSLGRIEERSDFKNMGQVTAGKSIKGSKIQEKKGKEVNGLDFRTEWKNQNRNIIPNIVNQIMSFLLKRSKSSKLVNKLFHTLPHRGEWTSDKFYLYMRKIKDSACHYLDHSALQYFFKIHDPSCSIYQAQQQQFYMKVSRICIINFLRNDAVIITLTSLRMDHSKKKNHLIARDALLAKFLQLARSHHF